MKAYYPGWDGELVEIEPLGEYMSQDGVMMADIVALEGKPFIDGHDGGVKYRVEAIVVKASDIIIK